MNISFRQPHKTVCVNVGEPLLISLPLLRNECNPNAYFLPQAKIFPFASGSFIGDVGQGGTVNCEILEISTHGNGTHTECVGHISHEKYFIKDCLQQFFWLATLVSVPLSTTENGDAILCATDTHDALGDTTNKAVIIRTLPNDESKKMRQWSGSNPPYLETAAAAMLRDRGVLHLVLDLPSVDKELDGGALASHKAFWNYPHLPRLDATITEMVYVPDTIPDGEYLLHFGILMLESDASPSTMVMYRLEDEL